MKKKPNIVDLCFEHEDIIYEDKTKISYILFYPFVYYMINSPELQLLLIVYP